MMRIPASFTLAFVALGVSLLVLQCNKAAHALDASARGKLRVVPFLSKTTLSGKPLYPAWWGAAPRVEKGRLCKEAGKCVSCHEAEAEMDPVHAIACTRCHKGDASSEDKEKAHEGLIADPGDLRTVDKTCGQCHPEEARRVARSPMALAPRMINHTRFAFGAQPTPEPRYATVEIGTLKQVPDPSQSRQLVDDLLRRVCLRCHLYTRGSRRWGERRGMGCSACHVPYPNNKNGRHPHRLIRDPGITACLKCHNSNHVGADYVGLFEKDSERGFRSPVVNGRQAPKIYGSEQHRLAEDVHYKAGMTCMDCHTLDEVHGTGELPRSSENGVKVSCEGCHIRGDHPGVLKTPDGKLVLLRGKARVIPRFDPNLIPHKIPAHRERLRCSACHAAWSFQDYGLHLMLEERADYWKWANNAEQNDPQIQELLRRNIGTYAELAQPREGPIPAKSEANWELPSTIDWLSGEKRAGAWFRGYTERIWSKPPLGLDSHGKISIMRPMYQYVVSHVDKDSNVLMDRHIPITGAGTPALLFNPYSPHTIGSKGRSCQQCHGAPKAAGLGEGIQGIGKPGFEPLWRPETEIPGHKFVWDALVDDKGKPLQFSSHPSAGPLDPQTVFRLLHPSEKYRAMWYEYLSGKKSR
jgi:hypothetical protein